MAEKLQYGHLNFFLMTVNSLTGRQHRGHHQRPWSRPCTRSPRLPPGTGVPRADGWAEGQRQPRPLSDAPVPKHSACTRAAPAEAAPAPEPSAACAQHCHGGPWGPAPLHPAGTQGGVQRTQRARGRVPPTQQEVSGLCLGGLSRANPPLHQATPRPRPPGVSCTPGRSPALRHLIPHSWGSLGPPGHWGSPDTTGTPS